jgi:hypothetical protein
MCARVAGTAVSPRHCQPGATHRHDDERSCDLTVMGGSEAGISPDRPGPNGRRDRHENVPGHVRTLAVH